MFQPRRGGGSSSEGRSPGRKAGPSARHPIRRPLCPQAYDLTVGPVLPPDTNNRRLPRGGLGLAHSLFGQVPPRVASRELVLGFGRSRRGSSRESAMPPNLTVAHLRINRALHRRQRIDQFFPATRKQSLRRLTCPPVLGRRGSPRWRYGRWAGIRSGTRTGSTLPANPSNRRGARGRGAL